MLECTIAESRDEDAGKVELCLVLRLYGAGRGRGVCVGVGHRSALRRRLRCETRTDGLARSAVAPMYEPAHGPERDTVGARGSRRALSLSSDVRSSALIYPGYSQLHQEVSSVREGSLYDDYLRVEFHSYTYQ
jgi:hypothetical protein